MNNQKNIVLNPIPYTDLSNHKKFPLYRKGEDKP